MEILQLFPKDTESSYLLHELVFEKVSDLPFLLGIGFAISGEA
jgi:hypothetical protein